MEKLNLRLAPEMDGDCAPMVLSSSVGNLPHIRHACLRASRVFLESQVPIRSVVQPPSTESQIFDYYSMDRAINVELFRDLRFRKADFEMCVPLELGNPVTVGGGAGEFYSRSFASEKLIRCTQENVIYADYMGIGRENLQLVEEIENPYELETLIINIARNHSILNYSDIIEKEGALFVQTRVQPAKSTNACNFKIPVIPVNEVMRACEQVTATFELVDWEYRALRASGGGRRGYTKCVQKGLVLYAPPGSGKTHLQYRFGGAMIDTDLINDMGAEKLERMVDLGYFCATNRHEVITGGMPAIGFLMLNHRVINKFDQFGENKIPWLRDLLMMDERKFLRLFRTTEDVYLSDLFDLCLKDLYHPGEN